MKLVAGQMQNKILKCVGDQCKITMNFFDMICKVSSQGSYERRASDIFFFAFQHYPSFVTVLIIFWLGLKRFALLLFLYTHYNDFFLNADVVYRNQDGRIWKERVCAGERTELPVVQEDTPTEPSAADMIPRPPRPPRSRSNRTILPSASAPEHNILKLLEECNSSGI